MTVDRFGIGSNKIDGYLLAIHHPEGGSKARFFLGRGFGLSRSRAFADALAEHAARHWPGAVVPTAYGVKHRLIGPLDCPDGSAPDILAVW